MFASPFSTRVEKMCLSLFLFLCLCLLTDLKKTGFDIFLDSNGYFRKSVWSSGTNITIEKRLREYESGLRQL